MVAHANRLRFDSGQKEDGVDEVVVNEEMWAALNEMPFHSGKLL